MGGWARTPTRPSRLAIRSTQDLVRRWRGGASAWRRQVVGAVGTVGSGRPVRSREGRCPSPAQQGVSLHGSLGSGSLPTQNSEDSLEVFSEAKALSQQQLPIASPQDSYTEWSLGVGSYNRVYLYEALVRARRGSRRTWAEGPRRLLQDPLAERGVLAGGFALHMLLPIPTIIRARTIMNQPVGYLKYMLAID